MTDGQKSLDDVMRAAWESYSGKRGYSEQEFRQVISNVAGQDLGQWLAERVDEPGELDYSEALEWFGLRFTPPEEDGESIAWLGVTTRQDDGRVVVASIQRDGPAYAGGVNAEDELVAINGYRVTADGLADRLKALAPGDDLVLVGRTPRRNDLTRRHRGRAAERESLEVGSRP